MSFYIFLKKVEKLNLEILPNGKKYTFFYISLNVIPIFKFVSILPLSDLGNLRCRTNPKCNTHMLGHLKITNM
jgi:hypothetical protein